LNLLWHSDLVVSVRHHEREAAALGIPVYSISAAKAERWIATCKEKARWCSSEAAPTSKQILLQTRDSNAVANVGARNALSDIVREVEGTFRADAANDFCALRAATDKSFHAKETGSARPRRWFRGLLS